MALAAGLIAGASWIAALATLSVSAQVALPDWVRGRGLALYTTVFFGCLTLGSAVWGEVAAWLGLPAAHFLAAAGAVAAIPLTWRFKLQTGAGIDLSPSMHWPAPITTQSIANDRGPVLVTVEYGSIRKTGRRFSKRLPSSSMCGAATAPMPGASSKTPPNRAACSRRSWSNPGWSICASTSASPKPIASCRMPSTVSTKTASPRSRTSSPPSLKAAVSQVPIDRNLDQAGHGQTP
jgi:hypothetical protein